MSLLNKMLRDLERRRGAEAPPSVAVEGVVPVAHATKSRKRVFALLVLLGIAGTVAALLTHDLPAFWRPSSSGVKRAASKVTIRQSVAAPAPVQPSTAAQPAPIPPGGQVSADAPAQVAAPDLHGELRLADEIVTPIGGGRQVRLAGDAAAAREAVQADGGAKAARALAPPPDAATTTPTPLAAPAQSRAAPGAIEVSARQPDARQRAHAAVENGLQAMARKQYAEAQRAFTAALEWNAGDDRARQALLSALLAQDDRKGAELVADEGALSAGAKAGFALVAARLKLERGAVKDALAVLERERAAGAGHADYQALWGNALARDGRHGEAARLYAAAVELAPTNPAHQIGLGYALRNDGQFASALEVFQSVAQTPGLSPQLADLVEQQLTSLRRLTVRR